MSSFITAIQFVLHLHFSLNNAESAQKISPILQKISVPSGKEIVLHIYKNKMPKNVDIPILAIPPIFYNGVNNTLWVGICQSFAAAGLTVITTEIESFKQYNIGKDFYPEVKEIIYAVTHSPLAPIQKAAIFSASYAAILTLKASNSTNISNNIAAMFMASTFYQVIPAVKFILSGKIPENDIFKLRLILNAIKYSINPNPELIEGLICALDDLGIAEELSRNPHYKPIEIPNSNSKEKFAKLNIFLSHCTKNTQHEIEEIIENLRESDIYIEKYAREWKIIDDIFTSETSTQSANFPITIVHGKNDAVISPIDSYYLHNDLLKANVSSTLHYTKIIRNHQKSKLSPLLAWDFLKLAYAFKLFIKSMI
jgi:hypothetical protein